MSAPYPKEENEQIIAELLELPDSSAREQYLASQPSLLNSEVVNALSQKAREEVRVDVLRAIRIADAALSIAEHLTDRQSLGIAMRAKANTLYAQGSNALAVEMHEKAIAIFAHLG